MNATPQEREALLQLLSAARDTPAEPQQPQTDLPEVLDPVIGTEDFLSSKLIASYGSQLRYIAQRCQWWQWDSHVWRQETTLRIFELAKWVCRDYAKTVSKGAEVYGRAATHAAVERISRSCRAVAMRLEQFDDDPFALNTPGGVVDLRTGAISSNSPEQYHTKSATVSPEDGTPELWLECLRFSMGGDQDLVDYLQRLFGYLLTGDTREQAFIFLRGEGGNGKGLIVHAIQDIMGDYQRAVSIEEFLETRHPKHETGLADLVGSRAAFGTEPNDQATWDESKIKACSGQDRMRARFMRGDFFEFIPTFKIVIMGNKKPAFRTIDAAWRRRLQLVPFLVKVPPEKVDKDLASKLKQEYPQILAWCIQGCLEWQRQGLNPPAAVLNATASYFEEQDAFGRWLAEECVIGPRFVCTLQGAYDSYVRWCDNSGESAMKKRKFGTRIDELEGAKREHGMLGSTIYGVGLKADETNDMTK